MRSELICRACKRSHSDWSAPKTARAGPFDAEEADKRGARVVEQWWIERGHCNRSPGGCLAGLEDAWLETAKQTATSTHNWTTPTPKSTPGVDDPGCETSGNNARIPPRQTRHESQQARSEHGTQNEGITQNGGPDVESSLR